MWVPRCQCACVSSCLPLGQARFVSDVRPYLSKWLPPATPTQTQCDMQAPSCVYTIGPLCWMLCSLRPAPERPQTTTARLLCHCFQVLVVVLRPRQVPLGGTSRAAVDCAPWLATAPYVDALTGGCPWVGSVPWAWEARWCARPGALQVASVLPKTVRLPCVLAAARGSTPPLMAGTLGAATTA